MVMDLARSGTELFGEAVPEWLNPGAFLGGEFSAEQYISELRTFVPFDTLRGELSSHLGALQRELVDLINRDYSDFVSLSTNLVDVDASVLRMRAPLLDLRAAVEASLHALQSRLSQRAEANLARDLLEILFDTFHVVSKVEKLIAELPNAEATRETRSILLERIASEINRLNFYITHANSFPFIQNMEKRIQSASSLLDTSLGHCLVDALRHRDETAVYNCLRAYAAIDNTKSAEEIFRSTVVTLLSTKSYLALLL